MYKEDSKEIKQLQAKLFGPRFAGASLSRTGNYGSASEEIVRWIANPMSFLVVSGPPGTGKTYLCAAIFANMLERCFWGRYFTEEELFRALRKGISNSEGDYSDHLLYLIDHNLVIFDDFGSMGHTDWREEVWTTAIDSRYRSMLPTVITTNLDHKEISETYGKRVASRMFDHRNTIIELDDESYDWRAGDE